MRTAGCKWINHWCGNRVYRGLTTSWIGSPWNPSMTMFNLTWSYSKRTKRWFGKGIGRSTWLTYGSTLTRELGKSRNCIGSLWWCSRTSWITLWRLAVKCNGRWLIWLLKNSNEVLILVNFSSKLKTGKLSSDSWKHWRIRCFKLRKQKTVQSRQYKTSLRLTWNSWNSGILMS